jgi:hypothetical protein
MDQTRQRAFKRLRGREYEAADGLRVRGVQAREHKIKAVRRILGIVAERAQLGQQGLRAFPVDVAEGEAAA